MYLADRERSGVLIDDNKASRIKKAKKYRSIKNVGRLLSRKVFIIKNKILKPSPTLVKEL